MTLYCTALQSHISLNTANKAKPIWIEALKNVCTIYSTLCYFWYDKRRHLNWIELCVYLSECVIIVRAHTIREKLYTLTQFCVSPSHSLYMWDREWEREGEWDKIQQRSHRWNKSNNKHNRSELICINHSFEWHLFYSFLLTECTWEFFGFHLSTFSSIADF